MADINFESSTVEQSMTGNTGQLSLTDSEIARLNLSAEQQKSISAMYKAAAKLAATQAKALEGKDNVSSVIRKKYLQELGWLLKQEMKAIDAKLEEQITGDMMQAAEAVVNDNKKWLSYVKMPMRDAWSHVPASTVEMIMTGQVYEGDWSLSQAIWGNSQKQSQAIDSIIAQGVALNKSSYEIAKDLEMYVDPAAKKPWDWNKVYPGTAKKIDYNAQRLARTLVSHAYQQSLMETVKTNPFVTGIQWHSAEIHDRTCQLCRDRHEQIFPKDALPLDHPNGLCTFIAVIPDDPEAIANRLADWAQGKPDPVIDQWASSITGKTHNFTAQAENTQKALGYPNPDDYHDWVDWMGAMESDAPDYFNSMVNSGTSFAWTYQKMAKGETLQSLGIMPLKTSVGEAVEEVIQRVDSVLPSGAVPPKETWIGLAKQTQVKEMLDLENRTLTGVFTNRELEAVREYTGHSYSTINGYLRDLAAGDEYAYTSDEMKEVIRLINKGMNSTSLGEDLVLRRGTNLGDLAGFLPGQFSRNLRKLEEKSIQELNEMFQGSVGQYAGFTSTSSLWDKGFSGHVEMVLYAPANTKATSIMSVSKFGTAEGETLLNSGTRIKILSVEESDDHKSSAIRVFAEILTD